MNHQILIKNQAVEQTLGEIAKFFEAHYPEYYQFCLREIPKLRLASKAGYTDAKDRFTQVTMKVPTVLFLACQWVMPGFGKDSDDLALLTKVWKALDAHVPYKTVKGPSLHVPKALWEKLYGDRRNVEACRESEAQEEDEAEPEGARSGCAALEGADAPD